MKAILFLFFLIFSTKAFAQFNLRQLTGYINMSYDGLDEILSKKGFTADEQISAFCIYLPLQFFNLSG